RAPVANQISNRISNFFLSLFSGRRLADTQCGLRRYPLAVTLELGARHDGYAFEADVILRAIAADIRLVEAPIVAIYPPERERVSHFDSVRDPARIVACVVGTLIETRMLRRSPRNVRPIGDGPTAATSDVGPAAPAASSRRSVDARVSPPPCE